LGFERDFPDATVIRLERNYRSTGHILAVAAGLIAHNRKRLGKTLFTAAEPGAKPSVRGVHDSHQEAREIGDEIEAEQRRGTSPADMAILLRTTAQMRAFEDRFNEAGIPYRIVGGPRFYERAEIRDALAYLRLVAQADDDLAFERIYNTPRRGLGEATLAQLHAVARPAGMSLTRTAQSLIETDELKPKPRQVLRDLLADFARWGALQGTPEELARVVIDESGLVAMWTAEKTQEANGRLDNLKELVRAIGEFPTLEAFLEHVALVTDAQSQDSGPRVTLMTLHAAKGLEFDVVFLPGWEEGLFPSQRALDDNGLAGLEEERRLAYVGVTRARRRVAIYFAANRQVRGLWQSSPPSRFIDELPEAHVEVAEAADPPNYAPASRFDEAVFSGRRYETPGWKRAQERSQEAGYRRPAPPRVIEGRAMALGEPTSAYRAGERVFHQKFGPGRVTAVDGAKLTVDFDKAGRKMVLDSFISREA
jgi:DNA helicase-2/ATP-dependent DNA helicase PcrA